MRSTYLFILAIMLVLTPSAFAHGPVPVSLQNVPTPVVPGLLDGSDPIVVNKTAAIALGKALFWDVNIGSDGMACASCHFKAGADGRIQNQLNPGQNSSNPSGQTFDVLPSGKGGANHTLSLADFPFVQFANALDNSSAITYSTDDVASSAGTFGGIFQSADKFSGANDQCNRSVDSTFNVAHVGTRRVEPRNTPTVINAIFNYRSFWDGRASNTFNGSSPWGSRDANAGVWVKVAANAVSKQRLNLINSSLASLATAPPIISTTEMGCQSRIWPDIGRKLLLRQALQNQQVHNQDSVLGPYSLSTANNLKVGLNTTYKNLITQAFNQKYWAYPGIGAFGSPPGQLPYNQMEANFSMFFGLAIQLYEATLVSDQSPFDLSPIDNTLNQTWVNITGTSPADKAAKIASLKNGKNIFFNNHCNLCHTGPNFTLSGMVTNATLLTPTPGKTFGPSLTPINYGPDAFGLGGVASVVGINQHINVVTRDYNLNYEPKLMDFGFANTGVSDPNNDPGLAGVDGLGLPLAFTYQYINYLTGNSSGVFDLDISKARSCDFIASLAINYNLPDNFDFTQPDGLIQDGSRESVLRNQDCVDPDTAYIPSIAAANANLSGPKMAYATKAAFKIPSLRNIELTGPYMHNGSMATLSQVIDFYARRGNYPNDGMHNAITTITQSIVSTKNKSDLINFLLSLTDPRVKYQQAPFDHPQLIIPNGHVGDELTATPGNPLNGNLAQDNYLTIPAVGASGAATPLSAFLSTTP